MFVDHLSKYSGSEEEEEAVFIQILHYIVNGDENLILFLFYSSRVKLRGKIYWYLQMICITRRGE